MGDSGGDSGHGKAASIAGAAWLHEAGLQRLMQVLGAEEGTTRVVGGAVRNTLLGQPVSDIDLATRLSPDEVMKRVAAAGLKAIPTGIDHGTVTVVVEGRPFEVTTLRVDEETFGRHARIAFTDDWREDAARRDFTINALYADSDGTVVDLVGGLADIAARRVRFIGSAAQRIEEDYLRILRFFRFHARYGEGLPDPEGLSAAIRHRDGLRRLSAERVGHEMVRLLQAREVGETVEVMADSGILGQVLGGVAYLASFLTLLEIESREQLAPDAMLRLAVLGCRIAEDVERLQRRLRLSGAQRRELLAGTAETSTLAASASETEVRAHLYRRGPELFRRETLALWARGGEPGDPRWRAIYRLPERWTPPKSPFSGRDVVERGVAPGEQVGTILEHAEARWIEEGFPDSPEDAARIVTAAIAAVATGGAASE